LTGVETSNTDLLGCDVRVYNPKGLPVRDPDLENEPKVVELRALTHWSDGKWQWNVDSRITWIAK